MWEQLRNTASTPSTVMHTEPAPKRARAEQTQTQTQAHAQTDASVVHVEEAQPSTGAADAKVWLRSGQGVQQHVSADGAGTATGSMATQDRAESEGASGADVES